MLYVVCDSLVLFADVCCCLLWFDVFVVCCLLFVDCWLLYVVCWLLFDVVCCLLLVIVC